MSEISDLAQRNNALTSEKLAIGTYAMSAHAKWWLAKNTPK
jgi:hypothetical protein